MISLFPVTGLRHSFVRAQPWRHETNFQVNFYKTADERRTRHPIAVCLQDVFKLVFDIHAYTHTQRAVSATMKTRWLFCLGSVCFKRIPRRFSNDSKHFFPVCTSPWTHRPPPPHSSPPISRGDTFPWMHRRPLEVILFHGCTTLL